MPSWSITTLLPFKRSSKHSSTSSTSSSSSASSTPLGTPSSSTIWSSVPLGSAPAQKTARTGRRLPRGKGARQTAAAQPKPVQPRRSSLFFPVTDLTAEQEIKCVYRASYAASCSDLLSFERRPVSDRSSVYLGGNQQPQAFHQPTFVPLATYSSSPRFSQSVGNLNLCLSTPLPVPADNNPYLALAPLDTRSRRISRKSVDYSMMMARKDRAYSSSASAVGKETIERGTEIWSSPFDSDIDLSAIIMPPPPVPARSALRPTASANNLRDRFARPSVAGSSTFTLPIDTPTRPAFSSSTSAHSQASLEQDFASSSRSPVTPSTSTESAFSLGRKKRPSAARGGSISGDPCRIKDGAAARESTSGVYTPTTFPGPQGLQNVQPIASQSRVYTPMTFLAPTPGAIVLPPPSPSRSTSQSSTSTVSSFSEVTTPRTPHTPLTPGSRFLGAMSGGWDSAVTGIRRASATLSTRSLSSPGSTAGMSYTPTSAREGYFPSTIPEGAISASAAGTPLAPSLWPSTPPTPGSTNGKPYGLGLGLQAGQEEESYRRSRSESSATVLGASEKFGGVLVGDVPKGKRKPVPKPAGAEGIREEEEAEVGYAM